MKRGRKSSNAPALAYDYRRGIALLQALAIQNAEARYEAIEELARLWHVEVGNDWSFVLIHKLAVAALEAAREEGE